MKASRCQDVNHLHPDISSPYCSTEIYWGAEKENFFYQSRASLVGDHLLYSRYFNVLVQGLD